MSEIIENVQRIRIDLAYHGLHFCGWQVQPEQRSVQGELMQALNKLYGLDLRVIGAGRTDAGVHALQQVAHFDLPSDAKGPPIDRLPMALSGLSGHDLNVLRTIVVPSDFHARFSPHVKTYAYHFDFGRRPHPMRLDRSGHVFLHVGSEQKKLAEQFCQLITGTHDFGSFCSSQNETETTVRTIVDASWESSNENEGILRVQGKGFLQHMVRILAGTLILVMKMELSLSQIESILALGSGHRETLGTTLLAKGLWLESTKYEG